MGDFTAAEGVHQNLLQRACRDHDRREYQGVQPVAGERAAIGVLQRRTLSGKAAPVFLVRDGLRPDKRAQPILQAAGGDPADDFIPGDGRAAFLQIFGQRPDDLVHGDDLTHLGDLRLRARGW